jgi:hypothetical protein
MEISVELYGPKIGGQDLVEMMMRKECKILLILKGDDSLTQYRTVLNAEEAWGLHDKIEKAFEGAGQSGFKIV